MSDDYRSHHYRFDANGPRVSEDTPEQRIAELKAQVTRLQSAVRHHCDHRAGDMMRQQGLSVQEWRETANALANGAGLHPGDLDPVNGEEE